MAVIRREEVLRNAMIDMVDGTITEYSDDKTDVHGIDEVMSRWSGIRNLTIRISCEMEEAPYAE